MSIVSITELPVEFLKPLSNLDIMEKECATFECEVSKPDLPAKWYQKGSEITSDWDRFSTTVDGNVHKLVISSALLGDTHKYKCVIGDQKTSAKLTVSGKYMCGLGCIIKHASNQRCTLA